MRAMSKPYGWRAGPVYHEEGASVADVIAHEREELGNEITTWDSTADLAQLDAKDYAWVCYTRRETQQYRGTASGQGAPYKLPVFWADMVAADNDGGYLVRMR